MDSAGGRGGPSLLSLAALALACLAFPLGAPAVRPVPVPQPPLLYGHAFPAIAAKAFAIGGALAQPPDFAPRADDPLSSTVYTLDVPAALKGTAPWTVDADAVRQIAPSVNSTGTKPPPLIHHCAVPVAHRILVLFGQTEASDGSRVPSTYPPLWFDPTDGTWSALKQDGADWITPAPRYLHSCAFHGATARVFVYGGVKLGDAGEVETEELWTLDVNDGWWEEVDLVRIGGQSLVTRRVGSGMHIVNGASNYLFICFGAPALNLPPVDASCHILDISGVYPSNVTLLPTTVLTGTPPKPRILSSFTTKIPYENSVMFGFGGFDGENYLEDLFAIDTSDLPKQASWIPVQPTPQYQNPKRYRPGPRADYGRFIPLPLPVQTQGLPQPQLLWGGSGTFNASKANKGSSTVAPMLPNVTDSLGTMFALDPETWGWTAAFPVPSTGDQISLWQQPSWKWIIAGVCLGVTAVIAMMMLCVCLFRGGLKDPAVPLWGRCWRVHLDDDEDDIYGKARSEKYPKILSNGEFLTDDQWKNSPTTNQVSPIAETMYALATLSRSHSVPNRQSGADADTAFYETFGPHAGAAFERRSLGTMGSKRDNIAAATAAGLLHSAPHSPQPTGIPERRSRPQSKRHSMGGLPTGDDSEEELEHADDAAPPLVPTKYVEELSEGMTVYDLFSTPVPPPSEPPVTGVASPEDVLSRPPMPSNWEYRTISAAPSPRILTYDLSAAPSSSRSSGKRSRAVPEQQGEDKKLMLSNPDMGLGLGIRSAVATEEPIAAGTPVTEKSGWKSSGTEQRTGTDGAGSVGPADL